MLLTDIKVLVVDDVAAVRMNFWVLLRQAGFRQIMACEGTGQAMDLLAQHQFHLVVADYHMGALSGVDLLNYIRGSSQFKDMGFVMVTAETTKDRVVEAIKAGVDDYLIKPLGVAQIQDKILGVLFKRRLLDG